jgi:hypothetical protein
MPYAFVAQVQFQAESSPELGQKVLESEVIPLVKSQAGFQKGTWFRNVDGKSGIGTAVFDTEANAKSAGEAIRSQPRPTEAPTIIATGVYEVVAEA